LSDINPFIYTAGSPDFDLRLVRQNAHWRHYQVSFPVVSSDCYPGGETARGEYFEPIATSPAPLVIMIHGWGDHSVLPFKWMLAGFLKRGFACFILYQPFHASRLPEQMKSRLNNLTPDEWMTSYQVAVTDIRRIIDWAERNNHIEDSQIAVMGISLGGFVASMAMGVDRRIKAGIFIVSGGNTGKIMQTNKISGFRKSTRLPLARYQQNQTNYFRYLDEIAEKGFENVPPVEPFFHIDPLTYAPMLKSRPVLMINALWDEVIPLAASREFQHACGDCELLVFPATHAGIWIWYPIIVHRINKFLEAVVYH
jgi:pimeloyl-ACP methyl ester carboxylesterase